MAHCLPISAHRPARRWCRVLHVMATYDQLDTTNLASAELVARAIQRIEEKHQSKLAANEDAGEAAFMGPEWGLWSVQS